jgi:ribonuclease E
VSAEAIADAAPVVTQSDEVAIAPVVEQPAQAPAARVEPGLEPVVEVTPPPAAEAPSAAAIAETGETESQPATPAATGEAEPVHVVQPKADADVTPARAADEAQVQAQADTAEQPSTASSVAQVAPSEAGEIEKQAVVEAPAPVAQPAVETPVTEPASVEAKPEAQPEAAKVEADPVAADLATVEPSTIMLPNGRAPNDPREVRRRKREAEAAAAAAAAAAQAAADQAISAAPSERASELPASTEVHKPHG